MDVCKNILVYTFRNKSIVKGGVSRLESLGLSKQNQAKMDSTAFNLSMKFKIWTSFVIGWIKVGVSFIFPFIGSNFMESLHAILSIEKSTPCREIKFWWFCGWQSENHSLSRTSRSFVSFRQKFPDFYNSVCSVFRCLNFSDIVGKRFWMGRTPLSVSPWHTSVRKRLAMRKFCWRKCNKTIYLRNNVHTTKRNLR